MLGSSKSGREYTQDQILLNSVSSIGLPLSLATSTTNTSNLLHPATSLSINNSNVLLTTTSNTNYTIASSTNPSITTTPVTTNTDINDVVKSKTDEKGSTKSSSTLVPDLSLKDTTKIDANDQKLNETKSNLDITSDLNNCLSSITDINFNSNSENTNNQTDDKVDDLQTSLFLSSSLPLNLDDISDPTNTTDFLNSAIDMDIDLLNTSLNDLNSLTLDINTTSTSINGTENTTTTTANTISGSNTTSENTEGITNATVSTTTVKTEANENTEDKKDILELFNTEDLENNIKLFPFSNQSLLLPQQKDMTDTVSLLSDQTLTDPSALSMITTTNASTTTASATTLTNSAAIPTTAAITPTTTNQTTVQNSNQNSNTNDTATVTLTPTTNSTVNAPSMAQPSTVAVTLNPGTNINVTVPPTTDPNAKIVAPGIPPSSNELLTANPNPMIGLPSMLNNGAFFNLNTDPSVATNIPGGAVAKVNYYPQPNTMVKAPINEVVMKKAYNGMVKQENIKNPQNRENTVKSQLNNGKINLKELNESNPNVKVNMKSVKSGAPKGRRVQSRNASLRPTLSYVELITEAICDSEDGLLSLQEIYDAIKRKYVYFRTADPAWQNSIRHNLSVHQSFTKITRPPNRPGKGFLWTSSKIDYQNLSSENRKRRKREHAEKPNIIGPTTQTTKNQQFHGNYPTTTTAQIPSTNVPQQNMQNNMNDIDYILNQQQQQQQPRISQKVMKILTDNTINTPSLKQLLFTGFKHMSNEPYHGHNGLNYPINSFDGYHGAAHASSLYGGSQYLANSTTFPTAQMGNSSVPLSLNPLIMPTQNASSALPATNGAFGGKGSSSFQNSFTSSTSALPLTNMDNMNPQKFTTSNSLYPSLLDPEYSFRYPSQSMFRSSYYYPTHKNDVMMHNNTRRYSFDSAMTSSAAFAAAAAAHNNASNPNNPTPPFFSLSKSQNAKNVPSGPNYIKKDREKKIMYEKMHLGNDFNNLVNQPPPAPFTGNTSNYIATAGAPINYAHKHLPTNYSNSIPIQPPTYNATNPIATVPPSKPLTTPIIYDTKTEHAPLDSTVLSSASTVIENETPLIVANKEQA